MTTCIKCVDLARRHKGERIQTVAPVFSHSCFDCFDIEESEEKNELRSRLKLFLQENNILLVQQN